MPRRRPGALRAERLRPTAPRPHIRGLSSATCHAIHLVERRSRHPAHSVGFTAKALNRYERFLAASRREDPFPDIEVSDCPGCTLNNVRHFRDVLEHVLRKLPRGARRELSRHLVPLDARYLRRTLPNPFAYPDQPWWHRRFDAD
ncbi:hypothetical protein [Nocardiopsis ganjiahuensis]|uniref:hypothetical protein n=1 Tax=Nocardiopsis ganjiahuensis TaxID=239984 RepID=UPI00035E245E|nr:hypothetical protein [Nocardiopsis ganjiahuensis]